MASAISRINLQTSFKLFETDPVLEQIAEIYGKDSIKCHLKDEEPSSADCCVFQNPQDIKHKSYFELESGRVVEVLHFRDGSKKCIGSFTYLPEECSRDGWATYHPVSDAQWQYLAASQLNESVDIEDWSCDWNSLQNFFYIKTGMKMSLLETMYCFTVCSQQRMDRVVQALTQTHDATSRAEVIGKSMPEILSLLGFFSVDEAPLFAGGNLITESLLNAQYATVIDGDWKNAIYLKPRELAERIQQHHFQKDGPLFVHIDGGSYILHANETGQCILIDPHNLDRSPGFYAQKLIKEFRPLNESLLLIAQDISGKKETYRGCDGAIGLNNDFDVEQLKTLLIHVREQGPLTAETLFEQITKLATQLQTCEATFSSE